MSVLFPTRKQISVPSFHCLLTEPTPILRAAAIAAPLNELTPILRAATMAAPTPILRAATMAAPDTNSEGGHDGRPQF